MQLPNIIKYLAVSIIISLIPQIGFAKTGALKGDGTLRLFSYHLNEFAEITYERDGKADPKAIAAIENIFRSRDGKKHHIDIKLIKLLDDIQDHFGVDTVEIISGYRSKNFNMGLKLQGRGVASESLHTKGLACDIHLDEITEEDLFEYSKSLKAGGVGFYPRYSFIHVDVGPVRIWSEKPWPKRVLVGTENNPNAQWTCISDKNIYFKNDRIEFVVTNNGYSKQSLRKNGIWIERFKRGRWSGQEKIKASGKGGRMGMGEKRNFSWNIPGNQPFGKYRFVIFPSKGSKMPPMYSNEFYIKKRKSEF